MNPRRIDSEISKTDRNVHGVEQSIGIMNLDVQRIEVRIEPPIPQVRMIDRESLNVRRIRTGADGLGPGRFGTAMPGAIDDRCDDSS